MAAGAFGADGGSVCGDDADDSAVFAAGEGRIHAHADAAGDAVGVRCADGGGHGVGISMGSVWPTHALRPMLSMMPMLNIDLFCVAALLAFYLQRRSYE